MIFSFKSVNFCALLFLFFSFPANAGSAAQNFSRDIFRATLSLARQGDASSQYELSRLYLEKGTRWYNSGKSLYWLKKSADRNHPPALDQLADYYYRGDMVPADKTRAFSALRRAAESGHRASRLKLALMYGNGVGTKRNPVLAWQWAKASCEPEGALWATTLEKDMSADDKAAALAGAKALIIRSYPSPRIPVCLQQLNPYDTAAVFFQSAEQDDCK